MIVLYRFRLIVKIISISACLALVYSARTALSPRFIKVHNSALYNHNIQEQIEKMITEKQINNLRAHNLYTELQTVQKSVEAIKIVYRPSKIAHVFVDASSPVLIIKDKLKNIEYVLAVNQAVIPRDTYTEAVLENLETISIESVNFMQEANSEDFLIITRKIPLDIYNFYTIIWHTKTEIILQSKLHKLRIISDSNSIINNDLIKYAERVYGVKNKSFKIDIRFKDMLICACEGDGK